MTALVAAAHALALGLFLLRERAIAGRAGFPLDDAWIHLHFARNLAEGWGLAYNPGVPVAGTTAPLWTGLLGAVFAVAGPRPWLAKVVGAGATVAAAALAARLARRWTDDRWLAAAAGVLAAVAGPLVWGSLSGMEVALAACLVTGAVLAHAAERPAAAALLAALAALARPEALLLAPLLWAAGPRTLRRTARWALLLAATLAPWAAFNLATTGRPLPATAAAKVEGGLVGYLAGAREPLAETLWRRPVAFVGDHVAWLASVDVALPLLVLVGLWVLGRRLGARALLPALVLVAHPLGMALLAPYRPPSFQEGRYTIHLLPLAAAVGMAGLGGLRGARGRRAAAAAVVAAALVVLWPAAGRYGWAVQNIEAMQVELGRWVAAETPRDARLALNDVGAIAYVSRREVIDVMGLVTPAIVPYRREGEAGVLRFLEARCPDYLIVFPAWFPELTRRADLFTAVHRVRLAHNTVAGADEMVVFETAWRRDGPAPRRCARAREAGAVPYNPATP